MRYCLKYLAPVTAKPAVEIPKILAQHNIFNSGQKPVAYVFVHRHLRLQHYIANASLQKAEKMRNQTPVVLIIRMQHNDGISPTIERDIVAGFLIGSIALFLSCSMTVIPSDFAISMVLSVLQSSTRISSSYSFFSYPGS